MLNIKYACNCTHRSFIHTIVLRTKHKTKKEKEENKEKLISRMVRSDDELYEEDLRTVTN